MENTESKTRQPQQQRSIEKRDKIIAAGMKLFDEKGFHNTKSTDIANEANVSIGTFYAYFKDKKEVFIEYMEHHIEFTTNELFDNITKLLNKSNDRRELIHIIVNELFCMHKCRIKYDEQIIIMKHIDSDIKTINEKNEKKSVKRTMALLEFLGDELSIKNKHAASHFLPMMLEDLIHYVFFNDHDVDEKDLLGEIEDLLYRYLFGAE